MAGDTCLSNLGGVALLDHEPTDSRALTQQRFERMTLAGGDGLPAVDLAGLPAGPTWPAAVQTVALLRFRHWFHPYLHKKYGDIYTVRLMPKGRPLIFFTRPEHAKEIFAGDPEIFHAGKGNAILGPVMGEHSLLLQDGAEHKRARKLLMPAFNGQALRTYQDMVTAIARDEVAHWPDGQQFRSHDRMNVLTLEVILRVVFGVTDEKRLAALRPRVNATVNVSPAVLLVWAIPALHRVGPWEGRRAEPDRARRADVRRDPRAAYGVRPRRAHRRPVPADPARARRPATSCSDMELRDQLVTLLLAGHETTATALAWALYELGRDPGADAPHPGRGRCGRRRRRRVARRRPQGVDAAAPGDPDGGADPDEAADDRRHRPPTRSHRRPVDPHRAQPRGQLRRPGVGSTPSGSSATTRRPTPGSRSVAGSAAASAPASR